MFPRGSCFNCGSSQHYATNCPEPRRQGNGAPILLCPVCKKEGHTIVQCPYVLAAKAQVQQEASSSAPKTIAKSAMKQATPAAHVRFLEVDHEQSERDHAWIHGELPGMDTTTCEAECFKVSTRSDKQKKKKLEKESKRLLRRVGIPTKKLEVPAAEDSDYDREHPRLIFPAVENSVKKALEELEEKA